MIEKLVLPYTNNINYNQKIYNDVIKYYEKTEFILIQYEKNLQVKNLESEEIIWEEIVIYDDYQVFFNIIL